MKNQKAEKCYLCGNDSTSREHVPPLCLFPERKDIGHDKFRINLITVPSCDLHNTKKTKEDEFLMACLAGIVGNNYIGYFHTRTKVSRALKRKKIEFVNVIMKDPKEFIVKTKNGLHFPLLLGHPDYNRLIICFEHIAFGLYYHEFKTRFIGECRFILGFIKYNDENTEKFKDIISYKFTQEAKDYPIKGANPDIFQYQFGLPDNFGLIP
jgi:hypothetical protein